MKGTYIDSTTRLKHRTSGYCRPQHGEVRERVGKDSQDSRGTFILRGHKTANLNRLG